MTYIRLFALTVLSLYVNSSFSQQAKRANLVYVDKSGVLRYTKTRAEAAFFGVNYTVPFAYGYRSIKVQNKDIKKEIDNDVYHLSRIGVDAFRVHVWDTEISDSLGNLLTNEHLQLFDYLVAQLEKRKIKIIITPIAFWGNGYPERDERTPGFSTVYGKGRANVNDTAIRAQENFVKQFFSHVNSFTNSTYTNDTNVVAVEINNEPSHSGPKSGVTGYINRMVAAIKSTGWTKPLFYNISQNPYYADAVAASAVDGFSFQWYPTGLVAARELPGNFLPHIDQYAIPYDTISRFHNKARMIYEFDAADLLQSNMYPAMARSYKTAGFQWATQFAYDPMATAYGNTEYQTHYLNLAYTPSKAISLLVASRVFHQVPRLKSYGAYPADSIFDGFRVSYRNQLSEMNVPTDFFYSNSTVSSPVNVSKLQHIAGVGSSPVVQYAGTGAYFLDKLEEGVWRLEVMPDAVSIRDPFQKASPTKEVTRIQWQAHRMQILLPKLSGANTVNGLNEGNTYKTVAGDNGFQIEPGTYLVVQKGKDAGRWNANSTVGAIRLGEFVAPQPFDMAPYLSYTPTVEATAGKPFQINVKAVGLDSTDKIFLQYNSGRQRQRIPLQRVQAYDYQAVIPATAVIPGILTFRLLLQKGKDYYSYPGNHKGNPGAWDYIDEDDYRLTVLPANASLTLYKPGTNQQVLTYPVYQNGLESRITTTAAAGFAYRLTVSNLTSAPLLGFETYVANQVTAAEPNSAPFTTLVIRARTTSGQPIQAKVALITRDAFSFAATATLTPAFTEIEIPLSTLLKDSMLLLPRPYPGFMRLWFEAAGNRPFSLQDVERIQVTIGAGMSAEALNMPNGLELESIWLKK
jgi:hypothetical protein